jgi:hypothetical protein
MIDSTTVKGPLGWNLAAIAVIVFFCIYAISTVGAPLLTIYGELTPDTKSDSLIEQHNEFALLDIARFNGRSAFFKPIPRPRRAPKYSPPPRRDPDPKEEEPLVPIPPKPPQTYMGPPLIAIIGDEAWFRGSGSGFDAVIRLRSGQEKDGLMLVGTEEPTFAMVQHRGGDYTLPLFTVEEGFFLVNPPPAANDDFLEEVN